MAQDWHDVNPLVGISIGFCSSDHGGRARGAQLRRRVNRCQGLPLARCRIDEGIEHLQQQRTLVALLGVDEAYLSAVPGSCSCRSSRVRR